MRVLLVNPPPYQRVDEYDTPNFTRLGLACLASKLRADGAADVQIVDAKFERLSYESIEDRMRRFSPDVVGLTAPLYGWIATLVATSTTVAVFMAMMTARDVMRGAHEMSEGMERIERNEFDAPLVVTDASEFAPLYEGFNAMAGRLKASLPSPSIRARRRHRAARHRDIRHHRRRSGESSTTVRIFGLPPFQR